MAPDLSWEAAALEKSLKIGQTVIFGEIQGFASPCCERQHDAPRRRRIRRLQHAVRPGAILIWLIAWALCCGRANLDNGSE